MKTVVSTITGAVYSLGKNVVSLTTGKGLPEPAEMLQDYKKGYQIGSQTVNNPIGTAKKIVNKAVTKAIKAAEEAKRKLCEGAARIKAQVEYVAVDIKNNPVDFIHGFSGAVSNNGLFNIPNEIMGDSYIPPNTTSYYAGKSLGDLASTALGTAEIFKGLGETVVGAGETVLSEGVLAVPGIALAVDGVLDIGYGASNIMLSSSNMGNDFENLQSSTSKGVSSTGKMTSKQATEAAKHLGFEKTNYTSHGQPVFKKGNTYITPDIDGHNGGVWKVAGSIKDLGSKSTRWGTYDVNLNRIGD